jgi:hypothetical protein
MLFTVVQHAQPPMALRTDLRQEEIALILFGKEGKVAYCGNAGNDSFVSGAVASEDEVDRTVRPTDLLV